GRTNNCGEKNEKRNHWQGDHAQRPGSITVKHQAIAGDQSPGQERQRLAPGKEWVVTVDRPVGNQRGGMQHEASCHCPLRDSLKRAAFVEKREHCMYCRNYISGQDGQQKRSHFVKTRTGKADTVSSS